MTDSTELARGIGHFKIATFSRLSSILYSVRVDKRKFVIISIFDLLGNFETFISLFSLL